ncbi:hypothetical protein Hanom_Chr05g00469641 [Helianthus anomalus]
MTRRLEKFDIVFGAMCISMFLVLVRNVCVPEWVLGFCGGGVVVGVLVDKNEWRLWFTLDVCVINQKET